MVARKPSSVPCRPLPNIIKPMPTNNAQVARTSFHIAGAPLEVIRLRLRAAPDFAARAAGL